MSVVNDRLAAARPCAGPVCEVLAVTGLDYCSRCLCERIGVTFRQLDFWARSGWLRPQRQASRYGRTGSGRPRLWDAAEIEIARRMGILTRAGIPPSRAAVFARSSWPRGQITPGVWLEVDPDRANVG